MTSANGRNRRFRREGTDRVVEEEFVAPQAPDVDESGQRTEYAHVHDEVLDMEGRLRTFTTVVEENATARTLSAKSSLSRRDSRTYGANCPSPVNGSKRASTSCSSSNALLRGSAPGAAGAGWRRSSSSVYP